jgi:hypothetical protein
MRKGTRKNTPTYEQLLESAINTFANEMGWESEDDVANDLAVENVTVAFEAIDLRGLVDRLRAYESAYGPLGGARGPRGKT